ncbi:MAG TPA: hypothetical protein VGF58_15825 [Burkholderiales bacterium]|jgi:hypothetical protein
MRKTLAISAVLACFATLPAVAQQKPDVTGGTAVASEPGKAAIARQIKVTAQVTQIEKATRTLTLKGRDGKTVDVVVSDDVKNFDQIKVGDFVVVQVVQALALELMKTKGGGNAVGATGGVATAKPGERPGAIAAREVTAIAKVTAVDPKGKTISLKGPRGNTVKLDVQNPDQFKVVKVGDEVQVTYTEAAAVSVEPAQKPAAKKK